MVIKIKKPYTLQEKISELIALCKPISADSITISHMLFDSGFVHIEYSWCNSLHYTVIPIAVLEMMTKATADMEEYYNKEMILNMR